MKSKPPFFLSPKNDAVTLTNTAADKEVAAMKYIAVRHGLTAFEPSKKARSPPGRIGAMRLYYTTQIMQTALLFGLKIKYTEQVLIFIIYILRIDLFVASP